MLFFGAFLCVFDNSYSSFFYIEKQNLYKIFTSFLIIFVYALKINLVYELCKIYEFYKLHELCKLYEYLMNDLK